MNTTSIENKNVLITGANRGIGRVIAETFLDRGATKVYAAVRDPDSASALVEKYGERVVPVALDLASTESVNAAALQAGDVDIVINNGGVLRTSTALSEDTFDSLDFELNVNLYGLVRVAQAFAPILKRNGGGALVQMNSVVSMKTFPDFGTYSASKAAAYSISQSLHWLLREQGTRVLSVHPGPIATEMGDAAGLTEIAEPPQLVPEAIIEALAGDGFHVYPDSMAKQIGGAYAGFANGVVEADLSEG
ncbi:MAG: SDR family oxidoreductase [Verrucomicrobiota bacterium]